MSHPYDTIHRVANFDAHMAVAVATNASGFAAKVYVYTCGDTDKVTLPANAYPSKHTQHAPINLSYAVCVHLCMIHIVFVIILN